jgi:hypothetical protein
VALVPFVVATIAGLVVLWPSAATNDVLAGSAPDELVRAVVTSADRGSLRRHHRVGRHHLHRAGRAPARTGAGRVRPPLPGAGGRGRHLPGGGAARARRRPARRLDHHAPRAVDAGAGATSFFGVGDEIVVGYFPTAQEGFRFSFADLERRRPMLLLAVLFGVAVLALGRWKGLRALVGLGLSLGVLAAFVLPAILEGADPLAVALVGSAAIALSALYLAHGVSARTTTAVLGTLLSLAVVGILSAVFVDLTRLTGLADEEATFVQVFAAQVDLRGLLLGGFVIGALGVLDDVTVTRSPRCGS